MVRQEHIHIVSAGEKIHDAYTAAIRDLQDITHTFVFADTALYTNSALDDERTKAAKTAARDAVNRVKTISLSVSIPASLVYIDPPADVSVKKAVQKIFHDHPGARYTFDLSEGSKDLSMALFLISLWLRGDAYYAFTGRKGKEPTSKLAVPEGAARDVGSNPNYLRILALLDFTPGTTEPLPRVLPRSYIKNQLEAFYVPARKNKGNVDIPDLKPGVQLGLPIVTKGKPAKPLQHKMNQGTLTHILSTLESWDLIRNMPVQDANRKEKMYQITTSGELALRFNETRPQKRE